MASWLIQVFESHRELYLICTNKTAVINYLKPNEISIYEAKIIREKFDQRIQFKMEKKPQQIITFKFKELLKEEISHYMKCINKHIEPITNGLLAFRAVKICEIHLKSAELGSKIHILDEIK